MLRNPSAYCFRIGGAIIILTKDLQVRIFFGHKHDLFLPIPRILCLYENKVNNDYEKICVNQEKLENVLCTSLEYFLLISRI